MIIDIITPTYNAELTLELMLKRIPREFYKKVNKHFVINDGSTDNTVEVIKKLQKKYKKIVLLDHVVNKGYGAAQKTGYNACLKDNADIAVMLHADGQYAPELLQKIIDPIEKGKAHVTLGSRILGKGALKGGMPIYKYIGNRVLTFIENLAYGLNISEYHSGYMAYSKKALTTIPFNKLSNTFHFDGEMTMMSGKKKLILKEIPIPTIYGSEKSHVKIFKYGMDVLTIIVKEKTGKYDF
jgi:glycosyltransferase involved in cell wall biosynthesis